MKYFAGITVFGAVIFSLYCYGGQEADITKSALAAGGNAVAAPQEPKPGIAAMRRDWEKLENILSLSMLNGEDKRKYAAEFMNAHGGYLSCARVIRLAGCWPREPDIISVIKNPPAADFATGCLSYSRKDYRAALKSFERTADKGVTGAMFGLGWLYENGQGVKQNRSGAAKWYRKAAERGEVSAQINLGVMYAGGEGVKRDPAEAAKWFHEAAGQGDAVAQYNLGVLDARSKEAGRNYAQALRWYRRSAEGGDASAQYFMGMAYAHGSGVSQNYAEALKWYRRAAEQGNAEAQFSLAVMYGNGDGVKRDFAQAEKWARKAAARGLQPAIAIVEKLGK